MRPRPSPGQGWLLRGLSPTAPGAVMRLSLWTALLPHEDAGLASPVLSLTAPQSPSPCELGTPDPRSWALWSYLFLSAHLPSGGFTSSRFFSFYFSSASTYLITTCEVKHPTFTLLQHPACYWRPFTSVQRIPLFFLLLNMFYFKEIFLNSRGKPSSVFTRLPVSGAPDSLASPSVRLGLLPSA